MPRSGLFAELRRRHVWRVAAAYAIAAWLLVQVATQVFPFFDIPSWAVRLVVVLLAIGFPVAVALAWVYEVTPEGIRRTESADAPGARLEREHRQVRRKLNTFIAGVFVLAVALLGWRVLAFRHTSAPAADKAAAAGSPDAATHDPGSSVPGSAAGAAASALRDAASTPNADPAAAQAIPAKSIAVLPFENLSDDKQNAYFVAGIQDLILTRLADIGDLKVISRTSTAKYRSRPENPGEIARQLGVATLLEGSVQKAGDKVLVNVQLIDARNDSHLWAQDYARKLEDVFGVEGEVAEKIAQALKAKLSPEERARLTAVPTQSQAAYDLFLRAEYYAHKADINAETAGLKLAIPIYREAVTRDPAFALAWARLSLWESQLAWFGGGGEDPRQLRSDARAHAARALELAPDLAASYIARGYSEYWDRADYPAALESFSKALALSPNDIAALSGRARVQRRQGHADDAIISFQQAVALDPRDSVMAYEIGDTNLQVSRFSEAEAWMRRALAIEPGNLYARTGWSNAILFGTGDAQRALTAAEGDEPVLALQRVKILTLQRKYAEALVLLDRVPDNPDNFNFSYSPRGPKTLLQADLYRRMGQAGKAEVAFTRALVETRTQADSNQGIYRALSLTQVASAEFGLGNIDHALSDIAKSLALFEQMHDYATGPQVHQAAAALYAQMGRPDLAVPLLERALLTSGIGDYYAPPLLWLDPDWDPIRHDPRFRALLAQYAEHKPKALTDPAREAGTIDG